MTKERTNKPELLAPAGGLEQLQYALYFGADAVYCATDRFGLRQRADNFGLEDIASAVKLAHASDAKLFVTCNAYMNSDDLKELPSYFEALAKAQVDAIIISDMGAFRLARKHAPNVSLHVSTQASCSNAEAAFVWYELGARRVVCAREMSLEDIAVMKRALPDDLELEVFVHGAMCMAISGRCLISDHLTGRSANRGFCTQPCRWDYTVGDTPRAKGDTPTSVPNMLEGDDCENSPGTYTLEEASRPGQLFAAEEDARGTYLMNSKDLCMLEHLDDLVAVGVDSLKIEGRNKKAFYVATVVNAYRQVLDGADPAFFLTELETISHRPYSTGFFYGPAEQDSQVGEYTQRYDWVGEVLDTPQEDLDRLSGRVLVKCRNRFYEGDELEVLSPHQPACSIVVRDLRGELGGGESEPASIANRAMDTYSFQIDQALHAHDILRVKRKDPSQKN